MFRGLFVCIVFAICSLPLYSTAENNEIRFGALIELSGPLAPVATDCRHGFDIALKGHSNNGVVGDRKIKVIYGDTKDDPKTATDSSKHPVAFMCYTALASLLEALKANPNASSREDVYKALLNTHSVDLLDGKLAIIDREAQYEMVERVIRKQGGMK